MPINHLGLGVMINMLGGNEESVAAFKKGVGQKITALEMSGAGLHFTFENGYKMQIFDDGQSCCESRFMTCDDDLTSFLNATLLDAEIREAPNGQDEYGDYHEVQFLIVKTSLGEFTCETHNIHNGYYGGFWVVAQEVK